MTQQRGRFGHLCQTAQLVHSSLLLHALPIRIYELETALVWIRVSGSPEQGSIFGPRKLGPVFACSEQNCAKDSTVSVGRGL